MADLTPHTARACDFNSSGIMQGKPLLNPGRMGSHTPQNRVRMALTARGHAVLGTDFTVQGELQCPYVWSFFKHRLSE